MRSTVASLALFLTMFLLVSVHGQALEPIEIKGPSAYLPFSLVMTYNRANMGASGTVEPSLGKASKPQINVGLEGLTFPTNEVDRFTIRLYLRYSATVNQTIWLIGFSDNIESLRLPIRMFGTEFHCIIIIQTSIKENLQTLLQQDRDTTNKKIDDNTEENRLLRQEVRDANNKFAIGMAALGVMLGFLFLDRLGWLKRPQEA